MGNYTAIHNALRRGRVHVRKRQMRQTFSPLTAAFKRLGQAVQKVRVAWVNHLKTILGTPQGQVLMALSRELEKDNR